MRKPIQVTQSSMPELNEYIEEIKELWNSRWLTNMGVKHKELESQLIKYLNVNNITLFTNGHLALEFIIAALGLTGEVITTPFTFASTTHAIVRNGLKPVFCDINQDDYTIDVNKIEGLITEKTTAIIPVHVYGNICNVEKIEQIAKKHNLKVIYDAAHTFGVKVNGQGVGSFGDASMFSFHATKVFNTIEGGAVTYNDPSLKSVLNNLKNFGITGLETVEYIGSNAKMNEFQAAMGICNLRHVDEEIAKRKIVVERYIANLKGLIGIKLSEVQEGVKSNYAYFPVVFEGYKKTRDEVFEQLRAHNIMARKYFYPLTNSFECYKGEYNVEDTPVAKYIAERVLTLPLYADLSLEDVDRICEKIKEIRGKRCERNYPRRWKGNKALSNDEGSIKAVTTNI
ncbi:dTDP-4-amino-4,6-dideoxygalactose transaminase [Desulfonispora thiosulfatigenes DSM 11270]|uniref:dTDP-4-amino-4,6-dideoxygalactose transaminase n=1 Tax=Desulfonispora thiosulfatigenes DSM 11270 TaxID=656914 RepID=A0A1W1V6Q2_DESTI|nr:DegT/DnrJ/EryC1/StrS family aminotransferase [Desulfonispora thiosulfatigenes]SMB88731.1 dTDP-4-amino-4,6-dideoxygalactose transaminase [Desulfonispora thiosulfatigenes DSM 11270]